MKIAVRNTLAALPLLLCAWAQAQTSPAGAVPATPTAAGVPAGQTDAAATAPPPATPTPTATATATAAAATSREAQTGPVGAQDSGLTAAQAPVTAQAVEPVQGAAPASNAAGSASALGARSGQITNTVNPLDLSNVRIGRVILGSGEPGLGPPDSQVATQVYEGVYHAPQYLPYYPTAATIWPRAIEVPCHRVGADLLCDRYLWRPEYGRAEYLFFVPIVQDAPAAAPPEPRR